jgi:hypothetical protein
MYVCIVSLLMVCLLIGGHGWFPAVNSVGCIVMALCASLTWFFNVRLEVKVAWAWKSRW